MLFTRIILHRIFQFLHQQSGEIRAEEHVLRQQGQSQGRTIAAEEQKKFWPDLTDQQGGGGDFVLQRLQQLRHAKNLQAKHWTPGRPNHNYQFDTI